MYPQAVPAALPGPPVKNTHDYNHPYGKVVAALHMLLTASTSARSHRAAASQRRSLSYDVESLETGSRAGSRVAVFVRPKVLLPSNGSQHALETQRIRELFPAEFEDAEGRPTRVWVLNVDRGTDEDMTYYVTVYACILLFLGQELALLVVVARAAGHSATNWHEQPQAHITSAIAGAFFPCNTHGEPSFTAKGRPASEIDADIMRKNLLHECEQIVKLICKRDAYGSPITAVLGTAVPAGHIGNAELLQHRGTRGEDAGVGTGADEEDASIARPSTSSSKQGGVLVRSGQGRRVHDKVQVLRASQPPMHAVLQVQGEVRKPVGAPAAGYEDARGAACHEARRHRRAVHPARPGGLWSGPRHPHDVLLAGATNARRFA